MLNRKQGERVEHVSNWYFRLNGILSIPGFIFHPITPKRYPLTDADLSAVRFPNSSEIIGERPMVDDILLTSLANRQQKLFLLVEVTLDLCKINSPWRDPTAGNMQRVIILTTSFQHQSIMVRRQVDFVWRNSSKSYTLSPSSALSRFRSNAHAWTSWC
jgi:hypothetical protein